MGGEGARGGPTDWWVQVMARCSPQDKLTLVRRLKEMGEVGPEPPPPPPSRPPLLHRALLTLQGGPRRWAASHGQSEVGHFTCVLLGSPKEMGRPSRAERAAWRAAPAGPRGEGAA